MMPCSYKTPHLLLEKFLPYTPVGCRDAPGSGHIAAINSIHTVYRQAGRQTKTDRLADRGVERETEGGRLREKHEGEKDITR